MSTDRISVPPPTAEHHVSGLLVLAFPGMLEQCAEEVGALPGVEVHYLYPDSSRLIAVQESGTAREQEVGLGRIQRLPSVLSAALVEHRIEK
jgi:nitrate reductase NapAB chaperone NapD